MTWLDKTKLKKQLVRSVTEAGFAGPKELQLKTLSRIIGGQDVIAVGPEGCGKTTTLVLAVLNRFNHAPDGVPQVLILAPDQEHVEAVIAQFDALNTNKSIAIVGLYAAPGIEAQMDALADGADIVVATPDRGRAIYLKLGLNLNKIELFIVDDADLIVKQGLQLQVVELANSITKAQRLVFTEVLHDKLHKMIAPFMKNPATVEVEEIGEASQPLHPQVLYHVPNFGTKLNLLSLFMHDEELFTKTVVFVNTKQTAEKIYETLQNKRKQDVAVLNQWFGVRGFDDLAAFKHTPDARILIVVNDAEEEAMIDLDDLPFVIHFEMPTDKELFLNRITNNNPEATEETLAITFATDLELGDVRKIEQASGQKIPVGELPDELVIAKEKKVADPEEKSKHKKEEPTAGAAFHEKKASNSKTTNYSSGTKAKMTKKRNHS
jgi:superfamily II DNA/RNA helicase